jgi:hypothetical protein
MVHSGKTWLSYKQWYRPHCHVARTDLCQ